MRIASLFIALAFGVATATAATPPPLKSLPLTVDTNGNVLAPTNFWTANAAKISEAAAIEAAHQIAAGQGITVTTNDAELLWTVAFDNTPFGFITSAVASGIASNAAWAATNSLKAGIDSGVTNQWKADAASIVGSSNYFTASSVASQINSSNLQPHTASLDLFSATTPSAFDSAGAAASAQAASLPLHAKADSAATADSATTALGGWPLTWSESSVTGLLADLESKAPTNGVTGNFNVGGSVTAGAGLYGNGAAITSLTAGNITPGGVLTALNGGLLTNLNANSLTGTVGVAQLPPGVVTNPYSGAMVVSSNVLTITWPPLNASEGHDIGLMVVTASTDTKDLFLIHSTNNNSKAWGGISYDGSNWGDLELFNGPDTLIPPPRIRISKSGPVTVLAAMTVTSNATFNAAIIGGSATFSGTLTATNLQCGTNLSAPNLTMPGMAIFTDGTNLCTVFRNAAGVNVTNKYAPSGTWP